MTHIMLLPVAALEGAALPLVLTLFLDHVWGPIRSGQRRYALTIGYVRLLVTVMGWGVLCLVACIRLVARLAGAVIWPRRP